jgi:prepilin-type N-terminal cleavage/methylation domain-containing protein
MNLFHKKNFSSRGFTLIELLVVVAIIGLLSSVVMASLNGARTKARDAVRKTELKQIQTALEMYYNTNNAYPIGGWYSSEPGDASGNNGGNWIPGLAPTYISSLPRDPRGGASLINPPCSPPWQASYHYYSPNGVNYKLLSHCAPENAWTSSDSFYDPVRPSWAWKLCSGEPACSGW